MFKLQMSHNYAVIPEDMVSERIVVVALKGFRVNRFMSFMYMLI